MDELNELEADLAMEDFEGLEVGTGHVEAVG